MGARVRPKDRVDASEGPSLPPLRPGLPTTPPERLQSFCLAILAQAVADDDADDLIAGEDEPWCDLLLRLVGASEEVAFQFKLAYLLGLLQRDRFGAQSGTSTLGGSTSKASRSLGETVSRWQAWPDTA